MGHLPVELLGEAIRPASTLHTVSTLLVIADVPWVVNEVRAALAAEPWDIVVITDPRQVIPAVAQHGPRTIVVDMQVGSMGGMAVIREIRQSLDPRPRLVLLLDRSADLFIARRAGADDCVLKPLEARRLREAVGQADRGRVRRRRPSSSRSGPPGPPSDI
ncbi:MAG: response regulator [Actinobacteria bacterium]|nr:response regulator [Actinomycetota bacterium]